MALTHCLEHTDAPITDHHSRGGMITFDMLLKAQNCQGINSHLMF